MLSVVHHPRYDAISVPDDHRFPMRKYQRVAETLVAEGIVGSKADFLSPMEAPLGWLELAHTPRYVGATVSGTLDKKEQRQIGFEVTERVVERSRRSVAGTVLAGKIALDEGIACNAAGGSHHAKRDAGAGFCVFNDVAVAIKVLLEQGLIRNALVIDCDVHQGDGTAEILNDTPEAYTLSIHCERNWPVRKVSGTRDVGLDEGLSDAAYLGALDATLDEVFAEIKPDICFYNAGVDPHRDDRLGKLCLTDDGILARDRRVIGRVREKAIPLVGVLGGGYSKDVDHLAWLHSHLFRAAGEHA